jgi:hypothetical protein
MRVLFLTGRETGYTRNDVLLRAFRQFSDVDVVGVKNQPRSLVLNSLLVTVKSLQRLISSEVVAKTYFK